MAKLFSQESVLNLVNSFRKSVSRFPVTILVAVAATGVFIMMVKQSDGPNEDGLLRIALSLILAIPLTFSAEIFEERKRLPRFLVVGLCLVYILGFYYFSTKNEALFENQIFVIKYFVLLITAHLMAAVAPYLLEKNIPAFWQYNKNLFLGIFISLLYSVTLAIGLTLAFLGVKELFELNFSEHWIGYIWVFCIGTVNTLIFLSKIPALTEIDKESSFPLALKYFTQYVLLPLVAVYLLILLAYAGKILGMWSLPKGYVSIMVLASAVFGILAFLLIYPLKDSNNWVRNFTRYYYITLLPLVILMAVSIYVRISQYGVTVPRYYVATLTFWLLGISLYFVLSKKDNILYIPLSLIIIGIFTVYAPFNASHSAGLNQKNRLTKVLESHEFLKDGKPTNVDFKKLSEKEIDKVYASVDYLTQNQPEKLKDWFSDVDFKKISTEKSMIGRKNAFYALTKWPQNEVSVSSYYVDAKNNDYISLENADLMLDSYHLYSELTVNGSKFLAKNKDNTLKISENDKEILSFDLSKITQKKYEQAPQDSLIFRSENEKYKGKLLLESGYIKDHKIENIVWRLLLTKK
ncbi:MAG: DUF4153 domain-containing protein [Cytophagaceae bacterium]|nr:DUF4153 domain-containing protein [Cytophagaceae bacterium]MBL0301782.1 DUF4153 domain-containing protein [Cytophagaceae bacterium]MBL0324608.1 DUF4153 domain-containing protein [Cytophagaceae bacterium]